MKKVYTISAAIIILMLPGIIKAQNIFPIAGRTGIGTATPQSSAILDLDTTGLGFLAPRMTKTQRDAIATPATGLMIYQTNSTPGFYYYDGGAWKQMTPAGVNKSLSNLTAPTAVNTDVLPGSDLLMNLGNPSLYWRSVYVNDVRFKDGTMQTTAFSPYAAGAGISITGNLIANTGDTNAADDANLSLANLTATSVNQSLIPNADNAKDLGSGSYGWKDLYLKGSVYNSGGRIISFAGTDNTFVGINAGSITTGVSNSFFGRSAGQSTTNGAYNSFFGQLAGQANTGGSYNAFFGQNSGASNTIGLSNAFFGNASGQNNTSGNLNAFFGQSSGYLNTTGTENSFFGRTAGFSNTTGSSNSFFGKDAGFSNSTGPDNAFYGKSAGYTNTIGYSNSFFGKDAGYSNTIGGSNAFFGKGTGYNNTIGNYNSFFGQAAGFNNTTGGNNSFFGELAGAANTTSSNNSFFGQNAGPINTGNNNAFFGQNAGSSNTTASKNAFFGRNAGFSNTIAEQNSFFGHGAGQSTTVGNKNSFFGESAGFANSSGYYNSFFGQNSGTANTSGHQNSFFGLYSGDHNTTGYSNSFFGESAGTGNTTGSSNVFIGDFAGFEITTGSFNTSVGSGASGSGSATTNSTAIGNGAFPASNQVRIGNSNVTSIGGFEDWTNVSDGRYKKDIRENVPGLTFINKLRPVTYHLDVQGIRNFFNEQSRDEKLTPEMKTKIGEAASIKEKILNTGFIAQEVEKAAGELNYDFHGVDKPQNENGLYGLRYAEFVVPLVKAVQELSKQNDELKAENETLRSRLDKIEAMFSANSIQTNTAGKSSANLQSVSLVTTTLEQNIPNPFNSTTAIHYTLPQTYSSAQIVIADNNGKILKKVILSGTGNGSLQIDASTLTNGTYHYSLYVNGTLVASKQMEHLK